MCKQILLQVIIVATLIITSHCRLHAQYHLGVEAGATLSSLYTIQEQYVDNFASPVIGARAGLFLENEIKDFFAIKIGVFGALKGCKLQSNIRWNGVYITVPALAIFTPVKPLKLGIGIELGALVSKDFLLLVNNKLSLGIRCEVAWQISSCFRLIAHSTVDVTPTSLIIYTDEQGRLLSKNNYNNITGGLSLAYTIKTFDKKG